MTIRPATVDDVDAIIPMVDRICQFHEQRDPVRFAYVPKAAEMYRGWLTERVTDPESVLLVADRGHGQLVGFLAAATQRELPIYRTGKIGFIHDVWVEEAYRNEGIARQMIMLALEHFAQIGIDQVRLDVLVSNGRAEALFRACGFRPSTMTMVWGKGNEQVV